VRRGSAQAPRAGVPDAGGASRHRRVELRGDRGFHRAAGRHRQVAHRARARTASGDSEPPDWKTAMSETPHPATSVEFLSRLHDRELSAAEARQFDAHRESCASCREAVEEYERSLSAFRASPTAAPASDLSVRILRKIREQSPSRRPFGVTFGIDVRWAGVLAAALLVVLIAPALFHREQKPLIPARSPASPEALPAYLLDEKTATANKEPGAKVAPAHPASANETRAEGKQKENAQPIDAAAERDFAFSQPQSEAKRD